MGLTKLLLAGTDTAGCWGQGEFGCFPLFTINPEKETHRAVSTQEGKKSEL